MSKKILVTGAAGLVGHEVCSLLNKEYEVYGLVRGKPARPIEAVNYHYVDLGAEWSADDLPRSIDYVVHLAQSSSFRDFPERAADIFRVNVESTARLLDYCYKAGAGHFVFASSGGVYGAGANSFSENSPIVPHERLGFYLGSKLCGEVLAQNYTEQFDVSILRFFFVYGAEQKRSMLIPRLVDNISNGRPVILQGEQGIRINPIHVSDAALAVKAALSLEGSHTFNIAGSDVLSLREISDHIGEILGVDPVYEVVDTRPQHLQANIDAMKSMLCVPQTDIWAGLKELTHGIAD